jgi:hypothetical protein
MILLLPLLKYLGSQVCITLSSRLLFVCMWDWSLHSVFWACKAGALLLEPLLQSTLLWLVIYLAVLGIKPRASCMLILRHWATSPALALVSLQMAVLKTVCPGWPWTPVLPISTSWVARITGVSHWCPAWADFLLLNKFNQCTYYYSRSFQTTFICFNMTWFFCRGKMPIT